MNEEIWKPISGYEGRYEVSDHGRVRSLPMVDMRGNRTSGVIRKPNVKEYGHQQVDLWKDTHRRMRSVHQLVLEAFVGPRPSPQHDGCHWDGNPGNNHVSNLRWDTKLGNAADTRRHGTHNNTKRTHCKRGHRLIPSNLTAESIRKGIRTCKSCASARKWVARHGGDVQETADGYYSKIQNAPIA